MWKNLNSFVYKNYTRIAFTTDVPGVLKLLQEAKTGKIKSQTIVGHSVRLVGRRYNNFLEHGIKCVTCGKEATRVFVESNSGPFHFNFYTDKVGDALNMLTLDHRKPLAKNGSNLPDNFQVMCYKCNQRKADTYEDN